MIFSNKYTIRIEFVIHICELYTDSLAMAWVYNIYVVRAAKKPVLSAREVQ